MEGEYFLIERKVKNLISYVNIYTRHFPKHEKYVLGESIRRKSYELLELVVIINKKFHKKTDISQLNVKHEVFRQLINISFELGYSKQKSYHHLSLLVDEIGKMIGAWIKTLN